MGNLGSAALAAWSLAVVMVLTSVAGAQDTSRPGTGASETTSVKAAGSRVGSETGYPIPRFVSLKASRANVRRGPGMHFPIDWTFTYQGMPLQVTGESGHWRRIRASDGEGGWMHSALLSGVRTVEVMKDMTQLRHLRDDDTWVRANLMSGVIGQLGKCHEGWCRVTVGDHSGWVDANCLWGVDGSEE